MPNIFSKLLRRSKRSDHPTSDSSGRNTPDRRSSDQPTPGPQTSGQSIPNEQRITDQYGNQPLPQVTSGGPPGPLSNIQLNPERPSGQRTPYLSSSDPPNPDRRPGGQHTLNPHSMDQSVVYPRNLEPTTSARDPRSSSQRTPDPRPSGHSTPGPRSSVQPTPNQQDIIDPYPDSQPILEPTSSGQPISSGIYIITNVKYDTLVFLPDPNHRTPLQGHYMRNIPGELWRVEERLKQQYSIQSVGHNSFANSGPRARVQDSVEGDCEEQLWRIKECSEGKFMISTTDTKICWVLPQGELKTPVELSSAYADPRCWWTFTKPADEHAETAIISKTLEASLRPPPGGTFEEMISDAKDVLKPMGVVRSSIKNVLEVAKRVEQVDGDWKDLINKLKFHVAIIQSQISSLEEDQSLDESLPPLNQGIEKLLQDYISVLNTVGDQLNTVYERTEENGTGWFLRVKKPVDMDDNRGVITKKAGELEDAFQRYTIALEHFVVTRVDQIQHAPAQFRLEFKREVKVAYLDRLKESNVYGNQHRQCLQGTRVKTLSAIREWAGDENTSSRIFCLLDVAGSGKSTVAKHMVNEWRAEKMLVGQFFFSRDTSETMSTGLFCSTVSDAFGRNKDFKAYATDFKEEQPDFQYLSFEEQFEGLVANPLRLLNLRVILTIDALDECEDRIKVLETLRDKQSSIPLLRTFVTGRPESDIKEWAKKVDKILVTNFRELEGGNRDVDIYIRSRLLNKPDIQDRVVHRAEGLFIWARIACDLLVDAADIDGLLVELEGPSEGDAKLDSIYRVALEQATPKDRPSQRAMLGVLQMILAAQWPISIAELEKLSPWSGRDVVEKIVTRLGSLLLYQDREDPIRLLHTTIREFLTARQRADIFYIQPERGHYMLALGSLNTIRHQSSSDTGMLDEISQWQGIFI